MLTRTLSITTALLLAAGIGADGADPSELDGYWDEFDQILIDADARSPSRFDYDAATGVYCDMVKAGIIDPAKVVRTALQDAASIAGLLITTEAMVADKPEKKAPAPAMPDMGGMDF